MSNYHHPLIVRLEVEAMRHQMIHAFSEHQIQMDAMVREAVAAATTPERLQELINDEAAKAIHTAIADEVSKFYRYGEGRKVIADVVTATLSKNINP